MANSACRRSPVSSRPKACRLHPRGRGRSGQVPARRGLRARCGHRARASASIRCSAKLREVPGVSVLIYDQTCAAERRRKRRRGLVPDPPPASVHQRSGVRGLRRLQRRSSNCLSVEPVETELGRKRRINQSSCNKDETVPEGALPELRDCSRWAAAAARAQGSVGRWRPRPAPAGPPPDLGDGSYDMLLTGIGGAGVTTAAALVAHGGAPRGQRPAPYST